MSVFRLIFYLFLFIVTSSSSLSLTSLTSTGAAISTTGYLIVPGASLYYETYGAGPLLLFVSGANGDADIWRPVAKILASNYRVAIYDRRGFSRSYLSATGLQNYTQRLQTDAADANHLAKHLQFNGTATVLGTSSGAIVALEILQTYSSTFKTVIVHEPPALTILPDAANLTAQQKSIYTTYRAVGIPAAMYVFAQTYDPASNTTRIGTGSVDGFTIDSRQGNFISGNLQYWFERELLQYPLQGLNLTNIRVYSKNLVLAVGKDTTPESPQYRANTLMASTFGLAVDMLAGGHVGYIGDTRVEFAADLAGVLAKRE
ncbi:alpha/beta-hydrolase [Lentithecium fluviatile CBS 122367]|uniref:Alpha/beta-hydrolase n=1 Tax=Lentithecium fluviatile CBS 122367 TaxID=1168545 RepID=A0A6G1IXJ9_9PLEO|nr:alpha/beta-hydrolase [Lentithecium fluviatile CBS 122367]